MLTLWLFCLLFSFVVAFAISPFVIKAARKLKAGQNILHYVDAHKSKQGTPTMCGVIFIIGTCAGAIFALNQNYTLAIMSVVTMLGFACLGFLDDFLKIKSGENEGLKPYQKIIGQLGLGIILAAFVYNFVLSPVFEIKKNDSAIYIRIFLAVTQALVVLFIIKSLINAGS